MNIHTFGCSITQGFALPDVVRKFTDDQGQALSVTELKRRGIEWADMHIYQASDYAWPKVLADQLGIRVENHARRGACFNQIARQCVVARDRIHSDDVVIVMWTYLSRLSLQWPARTAVPLCHIVEQDYKTNLLPGFNKFFGLDQSRSRTAQQDQRIHRYIHDTTEYSYLDPMGLFDRYYNRLILAETVDGLLAATGARVIHLSVETTPYLQQLEEARSLLDPTLREPWVIPDPSTWYRLAVDHHSCHVIHDSSIPPAENDMHPSVEHHRNFAEHIYSKYFQS
jgi:hypothetical protein